MNLYGFLSNNSVDGVDFLGLLIDPTDRRWGGPGGGNCMRCHVDTAWLGRDIQDMDAPPMPKWFNCLISCGGEVTGLETIGAAAAAASGAVPVPYSRAGVASGATSGHSSIAGTIADKVFGNAKIPKCCGQLPAPTLKVPWAKTAKWSRFVGRGVPVMGWALLGIDSIEFGCCYYNCMK
jgi:hypothetical protein